MSESSIGRRNLGLVGGVKGMEPSDCRVEKDDPHCKERVGNR